MPQIPVLYIPDLVCTYIHSYICTKIAGLLYLFEQLFCAFCENFDFRPPQVRSSYTTFNKLRNRVTATGSGGEKDLKLSEFGILPTTCISRISFIMIGDLRSGHFCDLAIISQWRKTQMSEILIRSVQTLNRSEPC